MDPAWSGLDPSTGYRLCDNVHLVRWECRELWDGEKIEHLCEVVEVVEVARDVSNATSTSHQGCNAAR